MTKIVISFVISLASNIVLAILSYIFRNTDTWGMVFLVCCFAALTVCIAIILWYFFVYRFVIRQTWSLTAENQIHKMILTVLIVNLRNQTKLIFLTDREMVDAIVPLLAEKLNIPPQEARKLLKPYFPNAIN